MNRKISSWNTPGAETVLSVCWSLTMINECLSTSFTCNFWTVWMIFVFFRLFQQFTCAEENDDFMSKSQKICTHQDPSHLTSLLCPFSWWRCVLSHNVSQLHIWTPIYLYESIFSAGNCNRGLPVSLAVTSSLVFLMLSFTWWLLHHVMMLSGFLDVELHMMVIAPCDDALCQSSLLMHSSIEDSSENLSFSSDVLWPVR